MAHGTRNRVWRVAVAGFGAVLCGGLVGCLNTDKPKEKVPTKPGIGLPGTPTLPPNGTATKSGTPGAFAGAGANLQPRVGTTGANTNTSGGTGIQPAGGFGTQPGGISAPTPPSGLQPGAPPAPKMSAPWDTNYQPSGPANPALPPMTDITPPAPFGGSGAPVTPPQPPAGLGPVAPLGGPN